jgi:hypothetical protein
VRPWCEGGVGVSENGRPNLLYVHSDQHSPMVLGCYGDPVVRTPNLDRLAPGGLVRKRVRPVTDLRAVKNVGLGRWKLVCHPGQEPQLFDLQEDPDELADRAPDPACHKIHGALTNRVLDGWDAEWVRHAMAAKRADNEILRAWERETQPPDQVRWLFRPEVNHLEVDSFSRPQAMVRIQAAWAQSTRSPRRRPEPWHRAVRQAQRHIQSLLRRESWSRLLGESARAHG